MKRFLVTLALAGWLGGAGLWAGGQPETPPQVNLEPPQATFLAPANPEATDKTLTVLFAPQAAAGRVLLSWTFTVYDAAGRTVWSKSDTQTKDRGFFGELFNLGDKPRVEVPPQLTWDGTDGEKPVPNGMYSYVLSVTDSAGKTTRTPPYTLTVQNNPIRITRLALDYAIFSPRGKRNTLTVHQDGTREGLWTGTFANAAGVAVRTYLWQNASDQVSLDLPPPDFAWDGKDDQGHLLPEGEYRYTLRGTNRSGAVTSMTLDQPVVISERPGALRLTSEQTAFSPRADKGWPTSLVWGLDSGNAEGLVDWTLTVTEAAHPKIPLWTKSGKAPLPASVSFDGKDQLGRSLGDGRYQAVLAANFDNGNSGESPSFAFEIDTAVPQGSLKTARPVFGGSGRPTLPLEFVGDGSLVWTLDVLASDGKTVKSSTLGAAGKASLELAATDANGKALPDDTYTLRASAHDRAGNLGVSELSVTKDSRPRKVSLEASSPVLVPGNAENGRVVVTPVIAPADGGEQILWTVLPLDAKGGEGKALVQTSADAKAGPFDWSGRDAAGKALPDGAYRVTATVTYVNGATAQAQRDLKIDSAFLKEPQGTLTASASVFGGTGRPAVTVRFRGDPDVAWTLELRDASGKVKGQYPLGTAGEASVEVPAANDGALADGAYVLKASATSRAGVVGSTTFALRKDSRPMKASLELSRPVLVPGKGANGQLRVTPLLTVLDSIEATTVEVRSAAGDVVAGQSTDGLLPFWDWNGLDGSGRSPADGAYQVTLSTRYTNGTTAKATADLKVDSTWLTEPQGQLTVSAPVFGSASRPSVTAAFTGDAGPAWTLEVLDKAGKLQRSYPLGTTGAASVDVGTDAAGKPLADGSYTLRATAKNKAGLAGTVLQQVRKDSRALKVGLDLSTPVLVPGNTLNGSVKITPVLEVLDSVESTSLSIVDPAGAPVDAKTWDGLIPFWDWDGKNALGKTGADGTYRVTLKVTYANGAVSTAIQDLKIDSTFLKEPQGTLTSSEAVFGGSGRAGVTVTFQGNAGLPWTLEILDKDGKTIRRDPLGDTGTASVDFRGLDGQNQALPDGPYTLKASAVSAAGVTGTAVLQLRKDSRQGKASVDLSRSVLVPGKGANGVVRLTPILEVVDSVDRTVLSVLGPDGKTVAEKSNEGTLPFWDWTGKDAQGRNLPNGVYQVALTVEYANGSVARARAEVKVDSTFLNDQGPLVEMTLSTKTFAPNNVDGPSDLTVSIKTTEGVVPVDSWQLVVLDPRGKAFRTWSGKGLPPKSVYWDGKADNNDVVESGEDYQLQLKVSDTQNHVTRKQDTVTIDISVVKLAEGKYKIVVSSIQFAGYSSDVFKVQGDLLTKNLYVLKRLANALSKFPGYGIRLEGYAVSEFWNDPKSAEREQKTQLLPLSLDRAQAVRNVMVLLGIDAERFTVQGFGGDKPLVPHGDLENRWKNRRVEFYLDKS
jgi:flagellar hook assembly protein FlgD/outer membrane protein OmpA-like peptidoglycan-associated protein